MRAGVHIVNLSVSHARHSSILHVLPEVNPRFSRCLGAGGNGWAISITSPHAGCLKSWWITGCQSKRISVALRSLHHVRSDSNPEGCPGTLLGSYFNRELPMSSADPYSVCTMGSRAKDAPPRARAGCCRSSYHWLLQPH